MNRRQNKVKTGDSTYLVTVFIEDDVSDNPDTKRIRQQLFIKTLSETPAILMCGANPYETLKIYHSGYCWVAEAQAKISETNGPTQISGT